MAPTPVRARLLARHPLSGFGWPVIAILAVVVSFWAYIFEPEPLTYPVQPLPVFQERIYPGTAPKLTVTRCASAEGLPYVFKRNLRDEDTGAITVLPSVETNAPKGCITIMSAAQVLPDDTKPGRYTLYGTSRAQGLFRSHEVGWRTEVFVVVPAPTPTTPRRDG